MNPSALMLAGAISGIIVLIFLIINFAGMAKDKIEDSTGVILHVVFGLWAGLSWVTFLVGFVIYLVKLVTKA
jgi:hypothetical protein